CRAWAVYFSPYRAVETAAAPHITSDRAFPWLGHPANGCLLFSLVATAALNATSIWGVRRWNSGVDARTGRDAEDDRESIWSAPRERELQESELESKPELEATPAAELASSENGKDASEKRRDAASSAGEFKKHRRVWDNPVLWRELRTWAHGRRIMVIRLAYLLLAGGCGAALYHFAHAGSGLDGERAAAVLSPLIVLGLVLVNAQSVTSFCAERDGRTLDLLLASDLTPRQMIFGKLGGVLYNTKEIIAAPAVLCAGLLFIRDEFARPLLDPATLTMLLIGLGVMVCFAGVLGIHAGCIYPSSRTAIVVSLGTVIFLFVGIFTCMRMISTFSGAFELQLTPFTVFMLGGGIGLSLALGGRNPSRAILLVSFSCPVLTFYAITSFLIGQTVNVFVVTCFTYGFAVAAMLVPALSEFDVAMGKTVGDEG
ncbi:MAG: ABC transporter permease, partial [Planctomycetales bacterium]